MENIGSQTPLSIFLLLSSLLLLQLLLFFQAVDENIRQFLVFRVSTEDNNGVQHRRARQEEVWGWGTIWSVDLGGWAPLPGLTAPVLHASKAAASSGPARAVQPDWTISGDLWEKLHPSISEKLSVLDPVRSQILGKVWKMIPVKD